MSNGQEIIQCYFDEESEQWWYFDESLEDWKLCDEDVAAEEKWDNVGTVKLPANDTDKEEIKTEIKNLGKSIEEMSTAIDEKSSEAKKIDDEVIGSEDNFIQSNSSFDKKDNDIKPIEIKDTGKIASEESNPTSTSTNDVNSVVQNVNKQQEISGQLKPRLLETNKNGSELINQFDKSEDAKPLTAEEKISLKKKPERKVIQKSEATNKAKIPLSKKTFLPKTKGLIKSVAKGVKEAESLSSETDKPKDIEVPQVEEDEKTTDTIKEEIQSKPAVANPQINSQPQSPKEVSSKDQLEKLGLLDAVENLRNRAARRRSNTMKFGGMVRFATSAFNDPLHQKQMETLMVEKNRRTSLEEDKKPDEKREDLSDNE